MNTDVNALREKLKKERAKVVMTREKTLFQLDNEEEEALKNIKREYETKRKAEEGTSRKEEQELNTEFQEIVSSSIYHTLEQGYEILQGKSNSIEALEKLTPDKLQSARKAVMVLEKIDNQDQKEVVKNSLEMVLDKDVMTAINVMENEKAGPSTIKTYIGVADDYCYVVVPVDGGKVKKLSKTLDDKLIKCVEDHAEIITSKGNVEYSTDFGPEIGFTVIELTPKVPSTENVQLIAQGVKERIENCKLNELELAQIENKVEIIEDEGVVKYLLSHKKADYTIKSNLVSVTQASQMLKLDETTIRTLLTRGKLKGKKLQELIEPKSIKDYADSKQISLETTVADSSGNIAGLENPTPEPRTYEKTYANADLQERAQKVYERLATFNDKEYLTFKDVAEIMGLSENAVSAMINRGLQVERINRKVLIKPENLDGYLKSRVLTKVGWIIPGSFSPYYKKNVVQNSKYEAEEKQAYQKLERAPDTISVDELANIMDTKYTGALRALQKGYIPYTGEGQRIIIDKKNVYNFLKERKKNGLGWMKK